MENRELLLLGLLRMEAMHGYQLNDFIEHRLRFITDLNKSTAYYTLDKLARDGYVSRRTEREGNRPERTVYEITDSGSARFHELLAANLAAFHATFDDDDIGVLFMSQLTARDVHAALLRKHAQVREALDAIGSHVDHAPDSPVQYVIEHRRVHLRADLAWIERLIERAAAALDGEQPWPATATTDPSLSLCLPEGGQQETPSP